MPLCWNGTLASTPALTTMLMVCPPAVPPLQPRDMAPDSRRTGVIAIKAGMTQEWDQWGVRHPLTVLWLDNVEVLALALPACMHDFGCCVAQVLRVHAGMQCAS